MNRSFTLDFGEREDECDGASNGMSLIKIDGSFGEGGGQIIRTCLSLSAITGKPFAISDIRAGRPKPGLQPQHLAAVKATAEICGAKLHGADIGSTHLQFEPQASVRPGEYQFEIGTAGASTLVAQTVLLPLCLAGGTSHVQVTGGTHVPHAPPAEYLSEVYLLALKEAGFAVRAEYRRAGFFPKGGGDLRIITGGLGEPAPIALTERGKRCTLKAYVVMAELPDHVAHRGAATIQNFMKGIGRQVEIVNIQKESLGPGAAVILVGQCEGGIAGFSSLGERGKPMEKVSEQACVEFMDWWKTGAACDEHLADQLVLPAAHIGGRSEWSTPHVTEHLRTVLWAVRHFLPIEHSLESDKTGHTRVTVSGVGILKI
jgi:RNA 3'-terminal phosphate cyclase (ATP)